MAGTMTSPMIFLWLVRPTAPNRYAAVCRKRIGLASLLIGQALGAAALIHAACCGVVHGPTRADGAARAQAACGRTPAGSANGALAESLNSTVMKIISASPVF